MTDAFDRLIPPVSPWRPYAVMTGSAQMPSSCWGRYGKVAVVETRGFTLPAMISEHARETVRVVELWDRRCMGGPRSAYARALVEAHALCDRLNRNHAQKLSTGFELAPVK